VSLSPRLGVNLLNEGFAFGTALFAAATLMSISAALMVLSLTLGSAIFGRVLAMWIAAEMNKRNQPIIHAIANDEQNVEEYLQAVVSIPNLVIEIKGHVLVNGRVVHRKSQWFCWSRYIGLLAKPFDIMKIAIQQPPAHATFSSQKSAGRYSGGSGEQIEIGQTYTTDPRESWDRGFDNINTTSMEMLNRPQRETVV